MPAVVSSHTSNLFTVRKIGLAFMFDGAFVIGIGLIICGIKGKINQIFNSALVKVSRCSFFLMGGLKSDFHDASSY